MLDQTILFPYWLTLKLRNRMYNRGFILKSQKAELPSICVGNIAAGGTGKTPHVEMIIRMLAGIPEWCGKDVAVLSRGYKRKSKGFQQVMEDGSAAFCGDEPLQIKRNCPTATVAVHNDRLEGCRILAHPEILSDPKHARTVDKTFPRPEIVILDDAFQHRKISPDVNIVLVDYNHMPDRDHLLPLGRLRDLPERLGEADILIVSKCPAYMTDEEKVEAAARAGVRNYDCSTCEGERRNGVRQKLFFTFIAYESPRPVFEGADTRYVYSKKAILFTGIAKDTPLRRYLSDSYKLVRTFSFPDHHAFTKGDLRSIDSAIKAWPTAAVATTQKDACRMRDCKKNVSPALQERLFEVPIRVEFLSPEEKSEFRETLAGLLRRS